MAYRVLSTKLYIPPIQPSLVRRPRLVQALEHGYQAGKRVTLVSAPAGFGKTTLIREWIKTTEPEKPFGWLSLDDGDNDPVRFLVYLISAIQKVYPEMGQTILASLNSTQIPPLPELLVTLINEITLEAQPFLVVLDDYHLIKKVEVHSILQLLLKHQPDALHLVILTREDPPFSLPRMRVQGQITEIRERDLRFTLPEAQSFLVTTMGLELSAQDIDKLEERTEGWAAGMQLAALALEDLSSESERRAFIEAFTGSNRIIVDYLISEVLQRQAETTRQFLLRTSILERFCAELCDYVVFDDNWGSSQPILEALEQENMFLVPLDNQRHWYRYHHLFSEMLFHSLHRSSPEQISTLHRKGSEWFEAQGLIPEAMKHALASKDWEYVNLLLNRHALTMIFQGYLNQVIEWCREIPKAHLEKSPDICIYYAWALVLTFRNDYLDAVEEQLQAASRAIEKPGLSEYAEVGQGQARVPYRDWVIGQTCVIRSQILLARFNTFVDPQELIALSLKGLELLPEAEATFRSLCRINLAHAELMQNHPQAAQKAFEQALPYMLNAGNFLGAVADLFYQARLAFYTGQHERAERICQNWKQKFAEMAAASEGAAEIPAARGLEVVQSILLLERHQIDEADRLLVKALELLGWGSWMELHGFIELARLRHIQRNDAGVQEILQRMSRLGPQHATCAEALDSLFTLRRFPEDQQVQTRAATWTRKYTPDPSYSFALGIGPYHRDAEYICNLYWAKVQIALRSFQDASIFISPALQAARECELIYRVAELSVQQALIWAGQGNSTAALEELERALEISETCSYSRFFNEGPEIERLLQQAVDKNIHASYARKLLSSLQIMHTDENISQPPQKTGNERSNLVEPLSERELEVLRLLASGLAPAEVAKKLYLSPYTLKAHTQNIYTKLAVHSRIEAINKARDLNLL